MKKLAVPLVGAGLFLLVAAGAVAAASPAPAASNAPVTTPAAGTTGTVAAILGLTNEQVMTFRQQGMSLAQIAEQQKVDPQVLIDALAAQWSVRIDARVAAGALTADQAAALKAEVAVRAKAMVNQVTPGGMRGAAVGAGPNGAGPNGAGRGMGAGAAGAGAGGGAGRGGAMRGTGAGTGTCPMSSTAPSS